MDKLLYIKCDRQGALDRHWIYYAGFDNLSWLAHPNQAKLPMVKLVARSGQSPSSHYDCSWLSDCYIQLYSTACLKLHSPVSAEAEKCDTQILVTKFSFVLSRYKIEPLSEYKPNPPCGKWSISLVLSRYKVSTPAGRT